MLPSLSGCNISHEEEMDQYVFIVNWSKLLEFDRKVLETISYM